MNPFVERHQDKIAGVISCFDRVVITGTLPDIGHAQAMAGYLTENGIATDTLELETEYERNNSPIKRSAKFEGEAGMNLSVLVRKHVDGVRTFFPTEHRERCE